ncbi:hypothetical protein IXO704_020520 [Xanthomonas oryzae pv. oryzae]|nr:hypothetical protein IXO704_020520 [Xanthomonas oryzae pv. oryzae]
MDAAKTLTGTYVQRVPRWWAGKGPAATAQISRSAVDRREVVCQLLSVCRSLALTTTAASAGCPVAQWSASSRPARW